MADVREDEVRWNSLAIVAFLIVFAACIFLLGTKGLEALESLSFLDILIIMLATMRTAHLLSDDKIFDFVRARFMDTRSGTPVKPTRGFRHMVCELLECIWCTGMWSALIVATMYLFSPLTHFAVLVLAFAGASSLLQLTSKRLAHTENK